MRSALIGIAIGLLTLIGAGVVSYNYLTDAIGPRTPTIAPTAVVEKQVNTPVSTAPVKEAMSKVPAKRPVVANVVTNKATAPTTLTPGPLRAATSSSVSSMAPLSTNGVIVFTNDARAQNGGLSALTENTVLDKDAQMKLADMFSKQYFEHVSPTGIGPGELANTVGYAYVIVGENLALGDFSNDQDLVTAWMNSPGHRANILNAHYQEIGVAVGRGMYEGRNTWLAVQSFGMPASACPRTDAQLKAQIDINNATIINLRAELDAKRALIDSTNQSDPNYNTYVNEFNALVPQYNNIVEVNRVAVLNYNASVKSFNACISEASGHTVAP